MNSIRRFLLISILAVMTLSYAITAYWNYHETLNDIDLLIIQQLIPAVDHRAMAHELAFRHIIPFFITFPIVSLAYWLLITQAFKPLKLVTQQLNARRYDNLSPMTGNAFPIEISPAIEAINALFDRLNSAYEREQRFTADAAHELRTPLAAIRTMSQLALGYKDIKSCHACLQDVLIGVDRCTHVVRQLAVLNSLRPEAILDEVATLDINPIIAQISTELRSLADSKHIHFLSHFTEPCLIQANLGSMQILLRNLIDNAIRYSPDHSTITLSTEVNATHTLIKINDQGPGIPEELRDRVFERFYRQLGTGVTGTGLGLSIVSTICQLHQARIILSEGSDGRGLCVTLLFENKA